MHNKVENNWNIFFFWFISYFKQQNFIVKNGNDLRERYIVPFIAYCINTFRIIAFIWITVVVNVKMLC